MATGKLAVVSLVVGIVAIGAFALPLLAGDDPCDPAKPTTGAKAERPAPTARAAALTRLAAILGSSKTTLSQAVATAESAAKGRAFAAELDREGGRIYYEVEVLSGGETPRVIDVLIDLQSGKVARMEDDDEGDDDDDDKSGKSDASGKSGKSSGKSDMSGKSGKSSEKSGKSGKSSGKSDMSGKSGKSSEK